MDKEISKGLFEVENPVYQSYDDILKKYLGNVVVVTNMKFTERSGIIGGIVRYYTKTSKEGYYEKWDECGKIPEYGKTMFLNFIPVHYSLGGLLLNERLSTLVVKNLGIKT